MPTYRFMKDPIHTFGGGVKEPSSHLLIMPHNCMFG
jgi:hypothetical protein